MKHLKTPFRRKLFLEVLAVAVSLTLAAGLSGCVELPGNTPVGQPQADPTAAPNNGTAVSAEPPGELVRILYETSGGSMEPRSDFLAELTPAELVRAEYWPENDDSPYFTGISEKADEPIRPEQWADVERCLTELYPSLEEAPEVRDDDAPFVDDDGEEIFELDGGDYWRLYLTWKTGDGERTVQYRTPSDRRITTFDALMREIVDPVGREIVWYPPPSLNGIFFHSEEEGYSFQFTYFASGDNYYFISRYGEGDGKVDVSLHLPPDRWTEPGAWFASLGLERFPEGWSFHDPLTVTLYYDDNTQDTVQPDEETAKALYAYFVRLTEEVR